MRLMWIETATCNEVHLPYHNGFLFYSALQKYLLHRTTAATYNNIAINLTKLMRKHTIYKLYSKRQYDDS